MTTLPAMSIAWKVSLDLVREVIRETPALQSLGTRVGSTKGYTDAEAAQIREAIRVRSEKRNTKKRAVAAV